MGALGAIVARDPRAARDAATALKQKGRGTGTELAHVNQRELGMLRRMSGRAPDGSEDRTNPETGAPMFDDKAATGADRIDPKRLKAFGEPGHINKIEDRLLGALMPESHGQVVDAAGRGADDRLTLLTPKEGALLKLLGGSGAVNPQSGLVEYEDGNGTGTAGGGGGDDGNNGAGSVGGGGSSSSSGSSSSGSGGPSGNVGSDTSYGGYGKDTLGPNTAVTERDVGYAPGMSPTSYSSPASINEAEASAASRAGSSMADDYAGMGPDRANQYGVGWNEYSEQTTGLQGFVNDMLGVTVKGPNVTTPNASWSVEANPLGFVGSMFGPFGSLAAKAAVAMGAPGNVSVANGQYTSQIGNNLTSGITDAMGGIQGDTAATNGPDTTNDGSHDAVIGNVTSDRAVQQPGEDAEDTPPLASTANPERNTNRSLEAGRYIDKLRQQWGFPKMADREGTLSNIVANQGRFGDTALAHLGPGARSALSRAGGVGTVNPATGARQYYAQADVERAYREVLGRAPDAAGLANWTADNPTGSYADLANAFRGSDEAQNNAVRNTYQQQLGRAAESPDVVQHYNTAMDTWTREGKDPYAELTKSFQGSQEYQQRAATAAQSAAAQPPGTTTTPASPTTPAAKTPAATPTNDYADFFAQFTKAMKDAGIGNAATPATPGTTSAGTGTGTSTTSPLQNVSSLTPVRVPRFRSRRYQGYIAPNFAS